MKTEMTISKAAAATLYGEIQKIIEEELNYPSHTDAWMSQMREAEEAIGEADRIVFED